MLWFIVENCLLNALYRKSIIQLQISTDDIQTEIGHRWFGFVKGIISNRDNEK